MIATAEDVMELTDFSVNDSSIKRAQAIVEVYAGRPEALINNIKDLEWMRYAVCWQAAYMDADPKDLFEQANVQRVSGNDNTIDFGDRAYQIAPLALKAIGRLSWMRSRSVATGSQYPRLMPEGWEYA